MAKMTVNVGCVEDRMRKMKLVEIEMVKMKLEKKDLVDEERAVQVKEMKSLREESEKEATECEVMSEQQEVGEMGEEDVKAENM